MKALRIQVERVVRPIRASYLRKDRMREELLAHLTRLYEEELARSGDAESAAAEAIGRFGDAPALSRELQAERPLARTLGIRPLAGFGPTRRRHGESPLRYLLRLNCWGLAIGIPCYALIALVVGTIASRRPHRADQVPTSQVFVFLACVAVHSVGEDDQLWAVERGDAARIGAPCGGVNRCRAAQSDSANCGLCSRRLGVAGRRLCRGDALCSKHSSRSRSSRGGSFGGSPWERLHSARYLR